MQTETLFNIADFEWVRQKLKRKITMTLKNGTTGRDIPFSDIAQKRRPMPAVTPAPAQMPEANHAQNTTTDFVLKSSASNTRRKRLVDEGWYDALCTDVRINWNQYRKRWDAEIDFELLGIPRGLPVTKFQAMGTNRSKPELTTRSALGRFCRDKLTLACGMHKSLRDQFVVGGRIYRVFVQTKKRAKGDDVDRPEGEWYSAVKVVEEIVAASEDDNRGTDGIPF